MKKFFSVLLLTLVVLIPGFAQELSYNPDSIAITYVPNSFKDNWEISLAGGPSFLWRGITHTGKNEKTYGSFVGGGGELTTTKWFNPYVAARLGFYGEYMNYTNGEQSSFNSYTHIDMLWDWTTQFGGVNTKRIFTFAPYVHCGLVGNPVNNVMVAGGLGFLGRFRVGEHWMINVDVRGLVTQGGEFGAGRGIGVECTPLIGFSYRFNRAGWDTKVANPSGEELRSLRNSKKQLSNELDELQKKYDSLKEKNDSTILLLAQANDIIEADVRKSSFPGLPDTVCLTVYYAINQSSLSDTEKLHLRSYLKLITLNDPDQVHDIIIIGSADGETGPASFNKKVAAARAESIKKALVEGGVKAEQITTQSRVQKGVSAREARASQVIICPLAK